MAFTVIIPARYASSRLPGKPLLDIAGKPMIEHVYRRACESAAERVIIATDDQRIAEACNGFGAEVCMTRADHESGTDRLQEVVEQFQFANDHIVVNVQGDEPLIPAAVINQVAENLAANSDVSIATLVESITDIDAVFDPNAVKAVIDNNNRALYFSRAPIPWGREEFAEKNKTLPVTAQYLRHVGIYAYRVGFLHDFVKWPPSPLELCEKLEQLRAMENGVGIHAAPAIEAIPAGIDTEADLANIRKLLA